MFNANVLFNEVAKLNGTIRIIYWLPGIGYVIWERSDPVFPDRTFVMHHFNEDGYLWGGQWDLRLEDIEAPIPTIKG